MAEHGERLRAWTLVDELVLDVFVLTRKISVQGYEDLPAALRKAALQSALKVVQGVHGSAADLSGCSRAALGHLAEFRYHLYLCRRLGLIDVRRYRAVALRLEKAQKSLHELAGGANGAGVPPSHATPRGQAALERAEELVLPDGPGP